MKKLLFVVFVVLVAFSALPVVWSAPDSQGTVPNRTPTPPPEYTPTPPAVMPFEEQGKGIGATSGDCYGYRCEDFCKLGLKFAFTWGGGVRTDCECDGVKVDPVYMMAWVRKITGEDLSKYSKWLLTFNEPEMPNDSTHPTIAAVAWDMIDRMYPDKYLISPSIVFTHVDNCYWEADVPNATCYWLDDFYSEYVRLFGEPPRINAIGGHCYVNVDQDILAKCKSNIEYFESKLKEWNISGGIWINEYAPPPAPTQDIVNEQMRELTLYLLSRRSVVRIAPWNLRLHYWQQNNTLQCYGHELTEYGKVFRDTEVYESLLPVIGK